jgi:hypothetical protein
MLARDLALALDPAAMLGAAGLAPDPWQRRVLASPARQQLVLAGRQVGKSTVCAGVALHQAATVPGTTGIVVSASLRQSQLFYDKVRQLHAALGPLVPPMLEESQLRFVLANGSTVVALPSDGRTIRGYTAHLLIEDEAAFCRDDTFESMLPTLATTAGRLVLLSSAGAKLGHFYRLWTADDPAWEKTTVTSYDVPRISAAWLEEQRRSMPAHRFESEFLCRFGDLEAGAFRGEDVEAAFAPGVLPLVLEDGHDAA